MILGMDHDEEITLDKLQSSILDHMTANVNYYKTIHMGHVLKDVKRYFKFSTYCDNVLNLIVAAMARALNLNLKIYQKGPRKHTNSEAYYPCNSQRSSPEIYM